MKKKQQHLRGSALVFSLLVLTMLLAIAVSGATITIATKQSARGTEKSILALQTADGAIEEMLFQIYKGSANTNLSVLASHVFGSAVCSGGVISGQLNSGSGRYTVTFFDSVGSSAANKIACNDALWRSKLIHMVATGTFARTTRAIDAGVKPL